MGSVALAHDTSNWFSLILEETNHYLVKKSLDTINLINDKKILPAKNVLMRTVWDELRSVISSKLGLLIKEIETAIVNTTLGKESIDIPTFSRMTIIMEQDLPKQLSSKLKDQYLFIKSEIWNVKNPDVDYQWMINKTNRIEHYAETKEKIMYRLDIESIKILCNGNLLVYDCLNNVRQSVKNADAKLLSKVQRLLKGSHSRGTNLNDQLHLLSCFYYLTEFVNEELLFSTTDKRMINNSKGRSDIPFKIVDIKKINTYLEQFTT